MPKLSTVKNIQGYHVTIFPEIEPLRVIPYSDEEIMRVPMNQVVFGPDPVEGPEKGLDAWSVAVLARNRKEASDLAQRLIKLEQIEVGVL